MVNNTNFYNILTNETVEALLMMIEKMSETSYISQKPIIHKNLKMTKMSSLCCYWYRNARVTLLINDINKKVSFNPYNYNVTIWYQNSMIAYSNGDATIRSNYQNTHAALEKPVKLLTSNSPKWGASTWQNSDNLCFELEQRYVGYSGHFFIFSCFP